MLPSPHPNVRLPELEITSVAPPAGGPGARQKGRRTTWVDAPLDVRIANETRRPRRFARFARPVLTAGTMLAVVSMAVVTSLPANAFYSETGSSAAVQAAAPSEPAQTLSATEAEAAAIERDGYTVTERTPVEKAVADEFAQVESFVNNTETAIVWPFQGALKLSDGFGPRVSPCSGCSTMHLGTDFLPGEGNPVVAMADGVVTGVESTGGLGYHVTIDHIVDGQLVTTTSAHMQAGSIVVSVGQAVRAGDQIGRVGNTGASTGPHLHFELRLGGTEPVDAYAWISSRIG
ncbi:M23 family metallopeptidase [Naasia sp. SYSU D00057]|uniref:M23 family metallopeptidase n=1 Tax=Naasia sp. SYSU D00057 TaxID=2817380 RepID=UPI001B30907B|nr:M23 family metallopeptidase [Naasia sp. SYSU D00057]